jgi:FkbM family methyltransferase
MLDQMALSVGRLASHLPRGAMFTLRALTKLRPNLRRYPIETRYGTIVCDLSETICLPLLKHGEYPHWRPDIELYSRLPLDGKIVLDIGANIGVLTRLFAKRAKHVHAFEPSPRAFRLLEANRYSNVTVYQVALADAVGTVKLSDPEDIDVCAIADEGIEVPCTTIDATGLEPDFIKIDVEGFEHLVLKGAKETLKRGPMIYFEALTPEALALNQATILSANPDYTFQLFGMNCLAATHSPPSARQS